MLDEIVTVQEDILWVGLGSPKQDIWIRDHLNKIRGSVIIPSGATFDFYSGRIKRAPDWVRNLGFEWFFRLTQDIKRLWIRYTVYNLVFVIMFIFQITGIVSFDNESYLKIFGHRFSFGNR